MARGKQYIADRVLIEDRGYSSPCWVWQLGLTEKGYARANVPGFPIRMRVHRAAYELHIGPIQEGLTIDHLCRVKSCCNPAHLEPVSALENWRRSIPYNSGVAGERIAFCQNGHPFEGDNIKVARDGNRFCVICHRARKREYMRSYRPPVRETA